MPLTPVPTRVTISVPDDLHKAIQAARGRFLLEDSADVPYSTAIEFLAREAVSLLAMRLDESYATLQKLRGRLKRHGTRSDYRFHPGLTEEDRRAFHWQLDELEEQAIGYAGNFRFEDVLAAEMTPVLLQPARARYRTVLGRHKRSPKKTRKKTDGAAAAQGQGTDSAFDLSELYESGESSPEGR